MIFSCHISPCDPVKHVGCYFFSAWLPYVTELFDSQFQNVFFRFGSNVLTIKRYWLWFSWIKIYVRIHLPVEQTTHWDSTNWRNMQQRWYDPIPTFQQVDHYPQISSCELWTWIVINIYPLDNCHQAWFPCFSIASDNKQQILTDLMKNFVALSRQRNHWNGVYLFSMLSNKIANWIKYEYHVWSYEYPSSVFPNEGWMHPAIISTSDSHSVNAEYILINYFRSLHFFSYKVEINRNCWIHFRINFLSPSQGCRKK